MEKLKIAFLGPVASYTHQAALESFQSSSYDLLPLVTLADVFDAVQSGRAWRGVVPFENSTNGSVVMTLDLFADRKKQLQDVLVCGEAYVDVRHCLVGRLPKELRRNSSDPPLSYQEELDQFEQIKRRIQKLYSHPQAWGQCEQFLSGHLKGIERQDVSSTSKAAEIVAQENPCDDRYTSEETKAGFSTGDAHSSSTVGESAAISSETAAISSETAAKVFDLDVLVHGMQDESGNMTRFFILKKDEPESPAERSFSQTTSPMPEEPTITSATMPSDYATGNPFFQPPFKTLISFVVPHTSPGALAKGLGVFGEYGLNLTSINTRPSLIEPWNYMFFVEFVGKREKHGRGDVNSALRDLQGVARTWRWLGSWEMQVDTAE